jgi:hypothetical protein
MGLNTSADLETVGEVMRCVAAPRTPAARDSTDGGAVFAGVAASIAEFIEG